MAADGTIELETKVNTTGIKNSEGTIKNAAKSVGAEFGKMGQQIQAALNGGSAQSQKLALSMQKTTAQIDAQSKKVDELKAHLSALQSGKEYGTNSTVSGLTRDLDALDNKIRTMQGKLAQMQALPSFKQDADKIAQTKIEIDKAIASADALGARLRNAEGAATQVEIDKTNTKLQQESIKLDELKLKAQETGNKLRSSMTGSTDSINAVTAGIDKFGNRIIGLAKRVFVFSMITRALRLVRATLGNALMSNEGFRQSLYQLQAALWTAFAPIYSFILPAIQTLVNWITAAINAILQFVATLTGKSFASMVANGKALKQQTDAYKNVGKGGASAAKGMKKATDEAKKQIAAFDELNILSQDKADADGGSGGGGGAGGGAGGAGMFGDDSALQGVISNISETMQLLMKIAGGALVAIGLLLLFTGHLLWGIGFIIAGAAVFSVAAAAGGGLDTKEKAIASLLELGQIVGASLAVIGVILLMFGHVPLGIGFIIVGASLFGVSTYAVQSMDLTTQFSEFLKKYEKLIVGVSIALLALGIVLLIFGVVSPITIGLVVAGAAGLAAEIALNEGSITQKVSAFLKDNAALIVGVSIAMLVLGIILACTGVALPLGIGLIVAGAAGLATEVVLNWQFITMKVSEFIKNNSALFIGIGIALVVLGIVLICTGVGIPLGIGLIVAGGASLAAPIAANWGEIKNKVSNFIEEHRALFEGIKIALAILGIIMICVGVIPLGIGLLKVGGESLASAVEPAWDYMRNKVQEVWEGIKSYWNEHIAKWFKASTWLDLAENIGTGLKNGFRAAINGVIGIVERGINYIVNALNKIKFTVPDLVPGIGGRSFGISLSGVSLPRLAQGAVLPPNKPFLAMVGDQKHGTNIEAPLETMIEAFTIALESQNQGGGSTVIPLILNGRELGRAVIDTGSQELRRTKGSGYATKVVFG